MPVRIYGDLLLPAGVQKDSTLIVGDSGEIAAIEPGRRPSVDGDFAGCLVVAGFIDLHVHGAGGADFMDGSVDAARTVLRTHARFGTTTLLATTLTAECGEIDLALDAVRAVMDEPGEDEARVAGVHLEGPYICAAKRGAQPLAPIRPPSVAELAHWIERSNGTVKLITMAPETAEDGGDLFIAYATGRSVRVSIGHTDCSYEQAMQAVAAGATHATHLFNAMPPLLHRRPGAVAAALESDEVTAELIADGVHIHPAVIKLVARAKGCERIVLITDAISGAAMPEGVFHLGGEEVIVAGGEAKFRDGTLAGSVLTMDRAFANIRRFAGIGAADASKMASLNAARELGIDRWTGSLEVRKQGDLAVINPDTAACLATMRSGKWIWRA